MPSAQSDSCTRVRSVLREWDEPPGAGAVDDTDARGLCTSARPVGDTLQVPLLEAGDAPPGDSLPGDFSGEGGSSRPDCANLARLCTVPSAEVCAFEEASLAAFSAAARCSRLCRRLYLWR
jgi:hypothetical protein